MSKKSNTSKRYTAEFKRDAVALALSSDKTVTEVARDLGVSPEGLRGWVKQAKIDRGEGPAGALTTAEREELVRLRRELAEAKKANEILVKAALGSIRRCNSGCELISGGVVAEGLARAGVQFQRDGVQVGLGVAG